MSAATFPSHPEPGRYQLGVIEELECVFDLREKLFTPIPAGFKVVLRRDGVAGICNHLGIDAKLIWMRVPTHVRTSVAVHPTVKSPPRAATRASPSVLA